MLDGGLFDGAGEQQVDRPLGEGRGGTGRRGRTDMGAVVVRRPVQREEDQQVQTQQIDEHDAAHV